MTSTLSEKPEVLKIKVPYGEELRCPHYNFKKHDICNKLLCRGQASPKPQEFKCPNCGQKTVFQLI